MKIYAIIQSIIFDRHINKDINKILSYLDEYNFNKNKMDITDRYYRFRQISPKIYEKKGYTKYYTFTLDPKRKIKVIVQMK